MNFEFFFAKKLQTQNSNDNNKHRTTSNLTIAICGMSLAIIIMILSINVVCGFKNEITNKIYNLDTHIKIKTINNIINPDSIIPILKLNLNDKISNIGLIEEKSVILKTKEDFKGLVFKGVDNNFNWEYLENSLIEGRLPEYASPTEILISKSVAKQLKIGTDDKIAAYFIGEKLKVRNLKITGIYNTDFHDFDNVFIIGNINLLNGLMPKTEKAAPYIGLNCNDINKISNIINDVEELMLSIYSPHQYYIYDTIRSNMSYFTWLELLDMNVVIIILIMLLVSVFTLITAMLMIVLEQTNTIGLLKALGANDASIKKIFIYLTAKLIFKALIWGNIIALGVSFVQHEFKLLKLNSEAYYISYVPIEVNWFYLIMLNIGVLLVAYISLITPSHIISTISPQKTIRYE